MFDETQNNPLANLISAANELGLDGEILVGFYKGNLVHLSVICADSEDSEPFGSHLSDQVMAMASIGNQLDDWKWEIYVPPVKH